MESSVNMEFMDDKSNLLETLVQRDLERKIGVQKKKDDKNLGAAENEKIDIFEKMFTEKVQEIELLLSNVVHITKSELPNYFNRISKEVLTLQKFVAASNIFLRSYDIKRCQKKIQLLTLESRELEENMLPKKKFGFKNKKKIIPDDHIDVPDFVIKSTSVIKKAYDYSNKHGDIISIEGDEVYKRHLSFENLESCVIEIKGSPSTLHLNKLSNCYIFTGPVSTSVFIEECHNSTLVIACQQLRLHSSKNNSIYLHVSSRAIMEDCSSIRIAPYNWYYNGLEEDFKMSGLDINVNNWKSIDDFNWLNVEKPSPNWKLIDENERIIDWKKVVLQCK